MTTVTWYLLPVGGLCLALGVFRVAAWVDSRRRQPCPHCGRRAARTVVSFRPGLGQIRPESLVYACSACGGAVRYARRPTGQEYWEPIVAGDGTLGDAAEAG